MIYQKLTLQKLLEKVKNVKNLTDQQKGSLMAFVAVMFITPDSLFIRLSNVDTWGLVFYRGIIFFYSFFRNVNNL